MSGGLCQCGCGRATSPVPYNDASRGLVRGAPRRYVKGHHPRPGAVKHGHARKGAHSALFRLWTAMLARCHNEKSSRYADYGGRGIRVCDTWRGVGGFARFIAHVGEKPTPAHTIDRIDNDRGYEPGNVRWATDAEQRRNKRSTVWVDFDGERVALVTACERAGIPYGCVQSRINRGWSVERTLSLPSRYPGSTSRAA